MKGLMDTHCFIWTLLDAHKLSKKAASFIENPENEIFVSAINFWEISLKFSLGKLELNGLVPEDLPELALQTGLEIIPLDYGESASFHKLPCLVHKDPFDRMLVWQAIRTESYLISIDQDLDCYSKYGLQRLW
jgi:PIN domain nuclease of toxin-antitoxin system